MNFIRSIYLTNRLLIVVGVIIALLLFGHTYPFVFVVGKLAFYVGLLFLLIDFLLLIPVHRDVHARRIVPDKLSNGDDNEIRVAIESSYNMPLDAKVIDELPKQLQIRDQSFELTLKPNAKKVIKYYLKPVKRGKYQFGAVNVYLSNFIGLLSRRIRFSQDVTLPVYPSFIQMRKYELLAISYKLVDQGIKKIRRIGHNQEFEQIKEYVVGDDFRTINWKATARTSKLMVNNYQDERSQQVYSIINKGRVMRMPFEGMTLLDYAINASLAISNIAIQKDDQPGLITFQHKVQTVLPASKRSSQLRHFMETLYHEKTAYKESDYSRLYAEIKSKINKRSLLLLYTNFESLSSMHRQVSYLRKIAANHLLVCIIFENTEITEITQTRTFTLDEVYTKTIAEKIAYEKRQIVKELNTYGIQSILTKPQDLTINTINKYLELKSRGMI